MVQSLDRALDLLEALANANEDVGLSQLAEQTKLPLGTVHRLLGSLIERDYAAQDKGNKLYGPGPKLLEVAARAANNRRFVLARLARPFLQELTAATGETSNLLMLQGHEGVYSEQSPSPHLVRMFTEVGQRVPLYCTGGGKAILSGFTFEQLDNYLFHVRLVKYTPSTLVSAEQLMADLATARAQGFALDDEEREVGVCCVAAPIFDRNGRTVAALSISGPTTRMRRERAIELGPIVREAARACSAQLGYGKR
jgi:IclR family transcriptional regulator, acetate operon repressor